MSWLGKLPKSHFIFWLIQIVALFVLWQFLPNQLTATLLLILVVINGTLLRSRQLELPTFTNVALVLTLAHFWQSGGFISPLVASVIIFAGVTVTGLIGRSLYQPLERDDWLAWLLIGLFTAQIAAFVHYWPISFFQKSALGTTVFYLVWQLWSVIDAPADQQRRPILAHFIFVGVAVMVVITSIAWTTWPGSNNF